MKVFKTLNISGTLLNREQLIDYMEKIAASHDIKITSDKDTYPIPNLIQNYQFILETYRLLNEHIKLGIKIHSAGEWILDNFYIIEENVKVIKKEISLKKYQKMMGLSSGKYEGFARSYVLASEIVSYTDCKINRDNIYTCLETYQKNKMLSNEEISNFGVFLKIAVINHIAEICKKIYSSQIQKLKVEGIIERIVEEKPPKDRLFSNIISFKNFNTTEPKYPFIEYMSYRLKKYGKLTIEYQKILEEEVSKIGLTVSDVIQKEHFYIANLKILIGNGIKSLKDISRIDFSELLGDMNGIEEILNKDPAGIYIKMDQETKNYYRNVIEEISKKYKISEIYISEKIIELARKENKDKKKTHVGYYIIDDGIYDLKKLLSNKKVEQYNESFKSRLYIGVFWAYSLYLDFLISFILYGYSNSCLLWIISFIILWFPVSEIVIRIMNYIMSKCKRPTILPKMDFENEIPESAITFVVIPTILKSREKVLEILKKLEVYYLANPYNNIYFALLGDCSEEDKKEIDSDNIVINTGLEEVEKLNKKYPVDGFNRFHFLYRQREWSDSESKFIGWERKRGLLVSFNKYIKSNQKNNFLANTIEKQLKDLPNVKYIITLDSDTNLVLNSAPKLIGAMSHILNRPVIKNNKVISGYGIMQPRIGLDLGLAKKSKFVELYAMQGGMDFYTNAISDIYQDYFNEGIFTGKGIYDVDVYNQILENEIPENTVLSHDLLEGNFLRCGLLTDVMLLDGYPFKYISYIKRNHRWTRGDFQISKWLKSKRLNDISKFKIFDNLRRGLIKPFCLFGIIFSAIFAFLNLKVSLVIGTVSIISLIISHILDIINFIIFKESTIEGAIYSHKKFSKDKNVIALSFYRIFLEILFLPYEACKSIDAIIRSIYRMKRKKKLLEWTTAEDSENSTSNSIISIYKEMKINSILGILFIIFGNYFFKIIGIAWIISPCIVQLLSKEKNNIIEINENDKNKLLDVGKRTWKFFEDYAIEENNYLICDNYQDDRKEKIVNRTSSTNIGLEFISIISAYDLGYIDFEKTIFYLSKLCNTVKTLAKWNGHLYNWYTIDTLEPLKPRYISTVDSGNFVGYLYIVKAFLEDYIESENIKMLYDDICNLINDTNFEVLYSEENKLLSIGFNLEDNKLTDSYYDFLASEARQASLVAIAKRQIPMKHWNSLSRTITIFKGYKGLISWTGTAFEYLMPNLNLESYKGSLLDESSKFAVLSQIEYCNKLNIPWGISESAFNLKDLNNNYQYKAFGIPWLGLKRGLENDIVVSPYSTFLALSERDKQSIDNIYKLEKEGALGKYGFYESIDYTPSRLKKDESKAIVKTYMAHHQGLILNSINNYLNNNILKKRFNKNPEIESVNVLLQERMPVQMIITKEKKEKPEKIKNVQDIGYIEKVIDKHKNRAYNVISNEEYMIMIDDNGNGYSKYKDCIINRYKPGYEIPQGIQFYVKDLKTKKVKKINEDCKVIFSQDKVKFIKRDGTIKYTLTIIIDPNKPVEIRNLEIENIGSSEELLEIFTHFIPVLSTPNQDYAHPAFNNMFINYQIEDDKILLERVSRNLDKSIFLATNLYTENGKIVDKGFELNGEKYFGRGNFGIPQMVRENISFSNDLSYFINKVVAQKQTIKLDAKEKVKINLIISVSENKEECLKQINEKNNSEEIERIFEISKARVEEEMKYLQITTEKMNNFQNLLSFIIDTNNTKDIQIDINKDYQINNLWKFGISGDLNILVVKIKSISDVEYLEEVIDAYIYFRLKKIYIDLVILNEESNVYKRYVRESIDGIISNKQIEYLKNINSGIFILNTNELEDDDLETILLKSKIVINASNGGIKQFIKSNQKNYNNRINKKVEFNDEEELSYKYNDNLKFGNEYGGFSEDFKEYKFYINSENKLPTVWSNIICNKMFGTVVTENMIDIIWNKNSRLNRLTSWNNDSVLNIPSQIIYIKDMDNNKIWTLNNNIISNKSFEEITYGFGWAKYRKKINKIEHETTIFVPNEQNRIITNIKLKNTSLENKRIKVMVYFKTVLGEDETTTDGKVYIEKNDNYILMKNLLGIEEFKKIAYITSDIEIKSFTKNKKRFFGNGSIDLPDCLFGNIFENKSGIGNCVGLEFEINIKANEQFDWNIIIGQENDLNSIKKLEIKDIENNLIEVKKKWDNLVNTLIIKTPDEQINALVNGWLIYQTIACRIWGKTAFYQSGGAYGFRDQLQDCVGMKYIDSNFLKEQIIKCSMHQFVQGDVLHWWHEETKRGCRTKFSDDLLWLPYCVLEYIEMTSDYAFLDEKIEYLNGEELKENEQERYCQFYKTDFEESLYWHCIKAIDRVCTFGKHGFPKIGAGDWNDGFSNIGPKGKGESVWLGFFLYDVLNRFVNICQIKNDTENYNRYNKIRDELKRNLNTAGWDGRWYKRAITDDEIELGSINSEECKIDSISQSWSVISDAGDNDKKYISMQEVDNYLVDKENKIIKLFTPAFKKSHVNPGYIKAYPSGVRENGGQYTHAAVWSIIAFAKLGFGDKALQLLKLINPIEHSINKESAKKYRVEPYVITADVYDADGEKGTGGWSWYTGSSSWYYQAIIEYIVGLNIRNNYIEFNPCISKEWKDIDIHYKYKTTMYNIKIKNPNQNNQGVDKVIVNGEVIDDKKVLLKDDGKIYNIEVIMR